MIERHFGESSPLSIGVEEEVMLLDGETLGSRLQTLGPMPLPDVLRIPLSEPLFLLGALFVAVVFFVPGGLASLPRRLRGLRTRREPLPEKAAS